ncbi:MAG: hypothetical protein LBG44_07685 [Gemmatimonadota bacterium]|nr:hypothetical protein [Gemmatimonadota bacterium]
MSTENQVIDSTAIRDNRLTLVERFSDTLAHEIRNPLHSMGINLEVLRRRLTKYEREDESLTRFTTILGTELDRLGHRVDLLLRLVRPDRDPHALASLGEIVKEIRELLLPECRRRNVALDIRLPASGERIPLSGAITRQALLDLLLSALESLEAHGTLSLSMGREDNHVLFEVQAVRADGSTPSPPLLDEDLYLPVVQMLADELDGELFLSGTTDRGFDSFRYMLSLPILS